MIADNASELAGQFLIAMPSMDDPNFGGTLIFIAEHNEKGALGLVLNRPMELDLGGLFDRLELKLDDPALARRPVFSGGPVQGDRGFVLHQPVGTWHSTVSVGETFGLTSSRDVLEAVASGRGPTRIAVMLGYSGWGPGQLEDEVSRNSWLTVEASPELIFDTPPELRLQRAYQLLGFDPAFLAAVPGHA
jgi:putative transcriptional regulator